MSPTDETVTPNDDDIDRYVEAFWRQAVFKAHINHMPTYFGPTPLESVRPPAWSWGETAAEADAFVEAVVSGRTTALAVPEKEYAGSEEPWPEVGEMGIVLDGAETPRALIVVTDVALLPLADVDPAATLVNGGGLPAESPIVVQQIRVLYSAESA